MKNIIIICILLVLILILNYSICKYNNYNIELFSNNENYLCTNDWNFINNKHRFEKNHSSIEGIEVRVLPPNHLLAGEKGVFAKKKFEHYDVIGEYTGTIKHIDKTTDNNLYIFKLIDNFVIDGEKNSNELKYVNSYINISDSPNLIATVSYIDKYPRVLYICSRDIEIGEELLIDYGDEYNDIHIHK
jgi:hypothetical protein